MPKYLTFTLNYGDYISSIQKSKSVPSRSDISEWTTKLIPELFKANTTFNHTIEEVDGKGMHKSMMSSLLIGDFERPTKDINASLVSIVGMTTEHLIAPHPEGNKRVHYVTYTRRNRRNW